MLTWLPSFSSLTLKRKKRCVFLKYCPQLHHPQMSSTLLLVRGLSQPLSLYFSQSKQVAVYAVDGMSLAITESDLIFTFGVLQGTSLCICEIFHFVFLKTLSYIFQLPHI